MHLIIQFDMIKKKKKKELLYLLNVIAIAIKFFGNIWWPRNSLDVNDNLHPHVICECNKWKLYKINVTQGQITKHTKHNENQKKNWFANKTHLESCTVNNGLSYLFMIQKWDNKLSFDLFSCCRVLILNQFCHKCVYQKTKCTNGSISGSYHIIVDHNISNGQWYQQWNIYLCK